jgi:hypothetical protein
MKMICIVKYKKNGEENSISFHSFHGADSFSKYAFSKGYKDIRIELKEGEIKEFEEFENILKLCKEVINLKDDVIEKSIEIYKEAINKELHKEKDFSHFLISIIYASIRILNIKLKISKLINAIEKYYYGYYEINDKKVAKYYNILVKELNLNIPYIGKFYYVNDIASSLIEEGIEEIINKYVILDAKNHLKEIKGKIDEYDPLILASSSLCLSIRDSIISKISMKYKIPYRSIKKNVRSIEDILEKNGYYKEIEEEEEIKEKIIEEEKEKEIKEKIEIPPYFILFIIFLIVYVILFLLHFLKIL